jgi:hypothetical protein
MVLGWRSAAIKLHRSIMVLGWASAAAQRGTAENNANFQG